MPGKGNGNPIKQFGPDNDPHVASKKGVFVRQKMAEWRKNNPDAPLTDSERKRMIKSILREGTPDALNALHDVILDPEHKDHVTAAKTWVEHDIGRPMQAVELSGPEKGPIEVESPSDRIARRIAGLSAGIAAPENT